jgi:hypothetical protein
MSGEKTKVKADISESFPRKTVIFPIHYTTFNTRIVHLYKKKNILAFILWPGSTEFIDRETHL